jgi:hypothetical protein
MKSCTEAFGLSAECDCPCRHVRFSQAHIIANSDARYPDNNALSPTELSVVRPRLRTHYRHRDTHDCAANKPYKDALQVMPRALHTYYIYSLCRGNAKLSSVTNGVDEFRMYVAECMYSMASLPRALRTCKRVACGEQRESMRLTFSRRLCTSILSRNSMHTYKRRLARLRFLVRVRICRLERANRCAQSTGERQAHAFALFAIRNTLTRSQHTGERRHAIHAFGNIHTKFCNTTSDTAKLKHYRDTVNIWSIVCVSVLRMANVDSNDSVAIIQLIA